MRINLSSCSNAQDNEDFIDFEITSSTSSSSSSSSSHSREFEFQMSANSAVTEHLASSPADELFYKGKLLPLHLPPRLQMVQNLLESSVNFEEKTESPFDTCNNTPTSSCRVSGELSSEDLFFECPNEMLTTNTTSSTYSSSIDEISSNSWSKKIKLMKQSSLSLTIKASKVLFKSLFTKTEHSSQDNEDNNGGGVGVVSKTMDYINKYMKFTKKNPFPFGKIPQQQQRSSDRNQVDAAEKEKIIEEISSNRRSFSLSIKKQSSSKSSSTSSSSSASSSLSSSSSASSSLSTVNSNGVDELRRSSSAKSEIESSIEGAIAYCKQSHANEKVTEVGFGSFSCEDQERSVLCKG